MNEANHVLDNTDIISMSNNTCIMFPIFHIIELDNNANAIISSFIFTLLS